jgi:hypothetical protein
VYLRMEREGGSRWVRVQVVMHDVVATW